MLASRGFVYATRRSAGELTRFHNKCDCRIVEGYDGMRVEGYDPDGLYKRYKSCRDTLRVDENPSPIRRDWERLPADEKAKYYKPGDPKRNPSYEQYLEQRIAEEMNTRDRQWLYDGTIPEISFVSESVERQERSQLPHELRTAERLSAQGIRCHFVVDSESYFDESGIKKRRGLPDLEGGIEIKSILTSRNAFGAVRNHFDNAKNKRGLTRLIIDSYDAEYLSDTEILEAIESLLPEYDFPHVSLVLQDGSLINVS